MLAPIIYFYDHLTTNLGDLGISHIWEGAALRKATFELSGQLSNYDTQSIYLDIAPFPLDSKHYLVWWGFYLFVYLIFGQHLAMLRTYFCLCAQGSLIPGI